MKPSPNGETPMDRPPHQHPLPADPFAKADRDLRLAEPDPWGLGQSPDEADSPKSTHDLRQLYLRLRNAVTSSAGVSAPHRSRWLTIASRVWAKVQSRFRFDRRVVAGLGLVGVACAVLIGLSRYDVAPSIKTVSGTTYNTAVERLTSAVSAALDLVSTRPAAPVATADVASSSRKPSVKPTPGKRGPINSWRTLELMPLISAETVQANEPAPIGNADVNATVESRSNEALALPQDDSVVETSIVYSPTDTDISPPVAIRSPGIATDRGNGDKNVSFIEILVSETGRVESARGRQRPATLGAALQSTMALSIVKTWHFRPARKNGHPVKYRTTVPFVESVDAGRND
jgi:hypothetical protein